MAEMSCEFIEAGLGWWYTPPRMAALIGNPETVALVACGGPGIQGFAVMHFGDAHAHLALLCVQPTLRQRGIGRRLNAWLIESARVAGIESICIELRADNAAALSFYRRLGFTETQLMPGHYANLVAARRMTLWLHADAL